MRYRCRLTFQPIGTDWCKRKRKSERKKKNIFQPNEKWDQSSSCQGRTWIWTTYITAFSILFIIRRCQSLGMDWKKTSRLKKKKKRDVHAWNRIINFLSEIGVWAKWHVNWILFTKFSSFFFLACAPQHSNGWSDVRKETKSMPSTNYRRYRNQINTFPLS